MKCDMAGKRVQKRMQMLMTVATIADWTWLLRIDELREKSTCIVIMMSMGLITPGHGPLYERWHASTNLSFPARLGFLTWTGHTIAYQNLVTACTGGGTLGTRRILRPLSV